MKIPAYFLLGGALALFFLSAMKAIKGQEVSSTIYFASATILWSAGMTIHWIKK